MKFVSLKTGLVCLLLLLGAPTLLAQSYRLADFEAPNKDARRIASLPKNVMSMAELKAHVLSVSGKVEAVLPADDKKMAAFLIGKASGPGKLAAMANTLWLNANYASAVMLMGRACVQEPTPANLSNYSAFLVMIGGEHLALPILQKLNQDFPNNSTVLNNLGQAWFGLGDLATAKTFLDSAVRVYAYHPQANLTKAVIESKSGNKAAAVESLKKSINKGYSPAKEAMLGELDYKVSGRDLSHKMHVSESALGLNKRMEAVPRFPKNIGDVATQKPAWEAFYAQLEQETAELNARNSRAAQRLREEALSPKKSSRSGMRFNMSPKIRHVLNYYRDNNSGSKSASNPEDPEFLVEVMNQTAVPIAALTRDMQAIDSKFHGSPSGADCGAKTAAVNKYLLSINTLLENGFKQHMDAVIRRLKNEAYAVQFSTSDLLSQEVAVNLIKLDFLMHLTLVKPIIDFPSTEFSEKGSCPVAMAPSKAGKKLPEFDDLQCASKASFAMPLIGSYSFSCNRAEFNLDPIMLPFQLHFKENLNTGEYITASTSIGMGPLKLGGSADFEKNSGKVELGYSKEIDKGYLGPVPLEASANATVGIEIDESGGSDLVIGGSVEGKAGGDAGSVSVEAGARWGWNAGGSAEGKSSFGGAVGKLSQ
jgi:tetratricopeptide (TPR) repeat protein